MKGRDVCAIVGRCISIGCEEEVRRWGKCIVLYVVILMWKSWVKTSIDANALSANAISHG